MGSYKKKQGKADGCWNCGANLDQPLNGVMPEAHDCGTSECVICPKCGSTLCQYDESQKEAKAERLRSMGRATGKPKGKNAGGGSPGSSDPTDPSATIPLPAAEPFPVEVFPAALQRYINEGSMAYGSPPDFFGNTMLAAAAATIGIRREIVIKDGFATVPCLYTANIGPPGSAKSPVQDCVLRPISERNAELLREYRAKRKEYERDMEEYRERKNAIKKRKAAKKQGSDEEGELLTALDALDSPIEPKRKRTHTNDVTVESLALIMQENPEGVGLFRDELVAWMRSCDMYRNGRGTDRQFYLSAWSAVEYSVDRKGDKQRGESILIPKTFLSIAGGIPPDMVCEFVDEEGRDDGLLARILPAYPGGQGLAPWTETTISGEAESAWRRALTFLAALQCERKGSRFIPKGVGVTLSAKEIFVDCHDRLGREASEPGFPPYLQGAWSKLRVYLARFALVLHLLRYALGETGTDERVDDVSMRGAVSLVDYYASQIVRVHALIRQNKKVSQTDTLLARIIAEIVGINGGSWSGTATALADAVCARRPPEASGLADWPTTPESIGWAVKRVAGPLKETHRIGYIAGAKAKDRNRTRLISFRTLSEPSAPSAAGASDSTPRVCGADGLRTVCEPPGEPSAATDGPTEPLARGSRGPNESQCVPPQDVTHDADGSDGSDGLGHDADDIEDGAI